MSRAQSFAWLLEECKSADTKIEIYRRCQNMLAPKELKNIHPLGKSPVVTIRSSEMSEPLVLAESGSIVEYLCGYFAPHLIPQRYQPDKQDQVGGETEQWLRYRFYMHYAEGSLMPLFVLALFMDRESSLRRRDTSHLLIRRQNLGRDLRSLYDH